MFGQNELRNNAHCVGTPKWIVVAIGVTHPSDVPGVDLGELLFDRQTGIYAINMPAVASRSVPQWWVAGGVLRSVPQRWAAERFLEEIQTMSLEEAEQMAKCLGLRIVCHLEAKAEVAKLQQDLAEAERRIQGGKDGAL